MIQQNKSRHKFAFVGILSAIPFVNTVLNISSSMSIVLQNSFQVRYGAIMHVRSCNLYYEGSAL